MSERKFYIKTLGCKVNQYESQLIREGFLRAGYSEAADPDDAGIYIVNTCTVTSTSDSKSLRMIRHGLRIKDKRVVVTGCMVEDRELDLSKFRGAELIVKNKDKHRIAGIIDAKEGTGCKVHERGISGLKGHTRVFVKVQDGCDNVCSYCKVRVVRGRSRSRVIKDVLDECLQLIRNGTKEIVLTGICLGAYGRDIKKDLDFSRLIKELCGIDGDWRLRLSSIEPKDINDKLISQLETQKRLCKHLHIPFQSGDDCILRKMKRPYKRRDYINIINELKRSIPDIAITTDIMIGFPGETEKRFENTVDFISEVRPMRMHIFPFSRRKGTAAYNYKDTVTSEEKRNREQKLASIAAGISSEFINKFIDKDIDVLTEEKRTKEGNLQGYTDSYIKVCIDGPDSLKGRFIRCRLALTNSKPYGILPPYLI